MFYAFQPKDSLAYPEGRESLLNGKATKTRNHPSNANHDASHFTSNILNNIGHKSTPPRNQYKSTWSGGGGGVSTANHRSGGGATELNDIQSASMRSYYSYSDGDGGSGEGGSLLPELLHHVRIIADELRNKHVMDETEEQCKSEWRTVALVIDRLLLITFFIVTVFTCSVIFINVPSGHRDFDSDELGGV